MPVFYDLDLRRASLREHAFSTPWYALPVVALAKALPFVRLLGFSHDPAVDTVAPFEVDADSLPAAARDAMAPLLGDLAALGFHSPIFHAIEDRQLATRIYWASLLHADGRSCARVQHIVHTNMAKEISRLYPVFFSALDDGTFLLTSGGKQDSLLPEAVRGTFHPGVRCAELWETHRTEMTQLLQRKPLVIADHDALRATIERLHGEVRDSLLSRGIFRPREVGPVEPVALEVASDESAPLLIDDADVAVLQEIDVIQKQKGSWVSAILTLVVSLALFVGAGGGNNWMGAVWPLVAVIFFHELGHYVAMRAFGYSNLKMFFIPFFGAAVAGKHYNVAGWKKAVVALAGPVPGIIVGIPLGIAGLLMQHHDITNVALLMMILNGFNLLPLLPLDGGWVMHATVFSRHPLLDVLFRGLAAAGLFVLAAVFQEIFFAVIGLVMLVNIPLAWSTASMAHRLRRRGIVAASLDSHSIPPQAALTILGAIRSAMPNQPNPKGAAHLVVNIFETLNARPPGLLASLALLGVHAGSFVVAFIFAGVLIFGQRGFEIDPVEPAPPPEPTRVYERGATEVHRGKEARRTETEITVIATFDDPARATNAFTALGKEMPADATLRRFGQSVFLILPGDRGETVDAWAGRLREEGGQVLVDRAERHVMIHLVCDLPAEAHAELLQYVEAIDPGGLIAPWSATWDALPEADRWRFRFARGTLHRARELHKQARANVGAEPRRGFQWPGRPDPARLKQLMEENQRISKAETARVAAELRAEGPAAVDLDLLDLWGRWNDFPWEKIGQPAQRRELERLQEQIAIRLGALPKLWAWPIPGADRDSVQDAQMRRNGIKTSLAYLWLRHPADGLPNLAEWLYRRGAANVRYEFVEPPADDDAPEP